MTTDKSKILAEYIKKGWKLTDVECPQCGSPLLKKDDRYFCAICNQEVYVVESHGEALSILEKDVKDKIRKRIIEELNLLYQSSDLKDYKVLIRLKLYLDLLKELE